MVQGETIQHYVAQGKLEHIVCAASAIHGELFKVWFSGWNCCLIAGSILSLCDVYFF